MTSILSCGYGRLHLMQSAEYLGKIGVHVKLLCGWVPYKADSWVVRVCSRIVGRNLAAGFRKRQIELSSGGEVCSCAWVDFLCNGLYMAEQKLFKGALSDRIAAFCWATFGWHSRRYLRLLRNSKRCVFHVRSGAGHGGAIRLAKKLKIPVLVDHSIVHPAFLDRHLRSEYEKNGAVFKMSAKSRFWEMITEDCEQADCVLVNSKFVKRTFVEQGFDPDKVHVAYLGVRRDFLGLRNSAIGDDRHRPLRLLFTGGFGFRKGAEYILEALRILKGRADCEFEMDVVGSYSESLGLIEKYHDFDLPITFHGPVPQDDLKRFLSQSDIYIFPSLAEGCASSGMEAMAAGLCVIATEESGLPITDGQTGCVVAAKNAGAIVCKVIELNADREDIDRIGRNAMELIRSNYSWEKYAENVVSVYKGMLSEV